MLGNLHLIDSIVILSYLCLCLVIGIISSKKIKNIKDYAIGGGRVPTVILVGTLFATDIGAGATVGSVEKVYTMGALFALAMLCRPFFWLVVSYVFGKNIERFKEAGCISISDIFEVMYGKPARWIMNAMALCLAVGVVALQITAMSYLFKYFFDISPLVCAITAFIILITYSFLGGIRAVALTDVMQAVIFFLGIPLACFIALENLGLSFPQLLNSLPSTHTSIDLSWSNLSIFLSLVIYNLTDGTSGAFIQRYLMSTNSSQLRKALVDCFWMSIPFIFILIVVGLIVKVAAPNISEPSTALFWLVDTYMPIGMKGILIAGLLAVIMSTADSWLNTASILCAHDILSKIFPTISKKHELMLAKMSTIAIGASAIFLTINYKGGVTNLLWLIDNLWKPIALVPLFAGFLYFKTNYISFITSCIFAISGVYFSWHLIGEMSTLTLIAGLIGSMSGLFGAHFLQKANGELTSTSCSKKNTKHRRISFNVLKLLSNFIKYIDSQVQEHGKNYYLAGAIGIVSFLCGLLLNGVGGSALTLVVAKAIAAIMCVGLLFHEYLKVQAHYQKYLAFYYFCTLTITYPFISGYILFVSHWDSVWMFNFLMSIIMLHFLAGLWIAIISSIIGIASSRVLYEIFNSYNLFQVTPSVTYIAFMGIMLIIAARLRHSMQKDEIDKRENYAKLIAHQVIQPISQTSLLAQHLNDILSPYQKPKSANGKKYFEIEADDFIEIKTVVSDFQRISNANTKTVRGLLNMMRNDIEQAEDIASNNIDSCVQEAISVYSAKNLKRIKISQENIFDAFGSRMFIIEAIRNIIGNALKYAGSKAIIEISYKGHSLHIKDNGIGIGEEKLSSIFDPFHNADGQSSGAGLGLAFCKKVMDAFGGSIKCESVQDEFTEFTLTFNESANQF